MAKSILPDADVEIIDGGMGGSSDDTTGIHFKIGVCSGGVPNTIYNLSDLDKVVNILGTGPLTDATLQALKGGSQLVRVVKADGSVAGTKTAVNKTGTGTGTLTVSGNPLDTYQIVIDIVKSGTLNVAQFIYSLDGGDVSSDKITVPLAGTYVVPGTGLTLTFTVGAPTDTSFILGDRFILSTKAPQMSNANFLSALDVIKNSNYDFEFIHVVGESAPALWTVCAAEAETLEQNHVPTFFICEARNINVGETIDAYVSALVADTASFVSDRVEVVAARIEATTPDGLQCDVNAAAYYTSILSQSKVCESPGKVANYSLSSAIKLLPIGLNQGHIQALDAARYVTARQYTGLPGFYITNGRMMSSPSSDYQFVETRRTSDKASREIRNRSLLLEHADIGIEEIGAIANFLKVPLDIMASDTVKEIDNYELNIPKGQNVLSSSTLDVELSLVPRGILRWITIKQRMKNPYLKG